MSTTPKEMAGDCKDVSDGAKQPLPLSGLNVQEVQKEVESILTAMPEDEAKDFEKTMAEFLEKSHNYFPEVRTAYEASEAHVNELALWDDKRKTLMAKYDFTKPVSTTRLDCQIAPNVVPSGRPERQIFSVPLAGGIGIALSPIILLLLGAVSIVCKKAGISAGERVFKWYLENTLTSKSAWWSLLFLGGLVATGIGVPILHSSTPVVGLYTGECMIIVACGLMLVVGAALYKHNEEKIRIKAYETKAKHLEENTRDSTTEDDFIKDLTALGASDPHLKKGVQTLIRMRQEQESRAVPHADDTYAGRAARQQQHPR